MPLMLETALIQKTIEGEDFGQAEIADAREILRAVRETVGAENARKWIRAALLVQQAKVLQSEMCEQEKDSGRMPCVIGELDAGTCKKNCGGRSVCGLWQGMRDGSASHRRESVQQLARKFSSLMQKLSLKETQDAVAMYCLRTACESEGALHETLPAVQKRETRKDCGAESLGHLAEGGAPWQRVAVDAEGSSEICDSAGKLIVFHLLQDPISDADKSPCITQGSISGQASIGIAMSAGFKAGQSGQARSVGYELEKSPTLASENGGNSVPSVCATLCMATQQGGAEIMVNKCPTITAAAGMSGNNQPVVCMQGNFIDREIKQHGNGYKEDVSYTLNTIDRHAVAYRMRGFGDYVEDETASAIKQRDYKDCTDVVVNGLDCRSGKLNGDLCGTLQAKPNGGYSHNCTHPVLIKNAQFFIVRRLTPTECTRLQGFFDHWGDVTPLDINNPAELVFWREVYKLDCQIKGKKISASIMTKPERLAKWHDNLHSDASEYKLWGNGIALPCALYVMQGIEEVLRNA